MTDWRDYPELLSTAMRTLLERYGSFEAILTESPEFTND